MSELVSIEAVWRDRAKIAAEAAEELADLIPALRRVAMRNVLGVGCLEGEALHEKLVDIVNAGGIALRDAARDAQVLAARSRAAADAYVNADQFNPLGTG
ncbi:hypothetical protein [Gordonia iterans]